MRTTVLAASLALALAAAGCGQAHLTPNHGAAYRKDFAAQQVSPPLQWRAPVMKLDPQEADVVAQGYIRSLSGKARAESPEPMIYVAPQQRGQAAPLAPSVPRE